MSFNQSMIQRNAFIAQQSNYVGQQPDSLHLWSAAMIDFVDRGRLPEDVDAQNNLIRECMERGESNILGKLLSLVRPTSLTLAAPLESRAMRTLLAALPEGAGPKDFVVGKATLDKDCCNLLGEILAKSKATSLTLDAAEALGHHELELRDRLWLNTLIIKLPGDQNARIDTFAAALIEALAPGNIEMAPYAQSVSTLKSMRIELAEGGQNRAQLTQIAASIRHSKNVSDMEVLLPTSSAVHCEALVELLVPLSATRLQSLAIHCQTQRAPRRRYLCEAGPHNGGLSGVAVDLIAKLDDGRRTR